VSVFKGTPISVEDMLAAKDNRFAYQQNLTKNYSGTIVSFKLNIPGAVKSNDIIVDIFNEGLLAWNQCIFENGFEVLKFKSSYEKTGPEYFAVLQDAPLLIKEMTAKIEEEHFLGRLFDFDVLDSKLQQYGRSQIGKPRRKCLICEDDAFVCGRSRIHDLEDVITHIVNLATTYLY